MVVVGVVAVLCMCARSHAAPDAATLNTQALELAYADKLSDALVLFQQAVDAAPGAPEYLNNLGVTHMRLDNMAEAKRCFLQALEVDRGHPDALRNLEELQVLVVRGCLAYCISCDQGGSHINSGSGRVALTSGLCVGRERWHPNPPRLSTRC